MIVSIFGIYFNILEIFLLCFLILYLPFKFLVSGGKIQLTNSKLFNIFLFSFCLYLSFLLISIFGANNELRVIKSFFKWIEIFALSILIFIYVNNFKNFRKIYWLFWAANFGIIAEVVANILINQNTFFEYRVFPGFPSAVALALILPFSKLGNKTAIILSIICFFSALLSLSRGVWLILFLYMIFFFKDFFLKRKIITCGLGVISLSFLLNFTPFGALIKYRLESTEASQIARIGMAKVAFNAFLQNPITGIGSLNFPEYLMSHAERYIITADNPQLVEPHNMFLQVAAEEGVFALLAFIAVLYVIYYIVFRVSRSYTHSNVFAPYLTGLKYLATIISVNLLFGYVSDHMRLVFCLFIGLSLSLLRLNDNEF